MPDWLGHSNGQREIGLFNLGFMDLGPTFFYFFIGFTYVIAFESRKKRLGAKATYKATFYKYLALIGAAAIIFYIQNVAMQSDLYWTPIHSIGLVGLLMLPFASKSLLTRAIAAVMILTIYGVFYEQIYGVLDLPYMNNEGGFALAVGFLGVTLLGTVLGDLYRKNIKYYALSLIPLIAATFILNTFVGTLAPDGYGINISNIIITFTIIALIFLLYAIVDQKFIKKPIPIISYWGQNLFFYFVFKGVLQFISTAIIGEHLYDKRLGEFSVLIVIIPIILVNLSICAVIAYFMNKKKIVIRI
jgi:hypothetical protein